MVIWARVIALAHFIDMPWFIKGFFLMTCLTPTSVTVSRRNASLEAGATMLEFAIVLSVLMAFTAGIINYGMALRNNQVMLDAARTGARAAAAYITDGLGSIPSCSEIGNAARKKARDYLEGAGLDIDKYLFADPDTESECKSEHGYLCYLSAGTAIQVKYTTIQVRITHIGREFISLPKVLPSLPQIDAVSRFRIEQPQGYLADASTLVECQL